jgi:hypothetical protein
LNLSTLVGAFSEGLPLPVELLAVGIELRKGLANEDSGRRTEKSEGRGIGVKTHAAVVENQNSVESVLVDGSKFPLGRIDVPAPYVPSANVQKNSAGESEQDGSESAHGKIRGIDPVSKNNQKKNDSDGEQ